MEWFFQISQKPTQNIYETTEKSPFTTIPPPPGRPGGPGPPGPVRAFFAARRCAERRRWSRRRWPGRTGPEWWWSPPPDPGGWHDLAGPGWKKLPKYKALRPPEFQEKIYIEILL